MRWGVPLLGWRTVYGGTVFGWHDNVKTDARNFISHQITESSQTTAHADPKASLSSQAPDSRMFGKGRIDFHHPHHYDMQSQFFDQVQHAWRWTGDPELDSEWGLERVKMPYGGDQCWPSDWVPSIWSVREMWSGDNYQLALAYFQTGLADDGWKVLHGTFPQQMLFGKVPGDMGHPAGGTDFNDCNSLFARAVVEGLFGYIPDYPNKVVKIAPQFPGDWDHANINTPDVTMNYKRSGGNLEFNVTLAHAGALEVQIPVSTKAVQSVTVDGKPAKWELAPGFDRSLIKLALPATASANIEVTCQDALKNCFHLAMGQLAEANHRSGQ